MNNKERIDAYLRNKMEHQERLDFEEEIASNPQLAEDFRLALARARCLQHNDQETGDTGPEDNPIEDHIEKVSPSTISEKHKGRNRPLWLLSTSSSVTTKYVWGSSLAIGIVFVILLLYILQIEVYEKAQQQTEVDMIEQLPISNELDYYMDAHKYEKALLVIDSLQKDLILIYSKSTIEDENDSTLKAKQREKVHTEKMLYELTWKKLKILTALEDFDKASILLNEFKKKKGRHQQEAKRLWDELEKEN